MDCWLNNVCLTGNPIVGSLIYEGRPYVVKTNKITLFAVEAENGLSPPLSGRTGQVVPRWLASTAEAIVSFATLLDFLAAAAWCHACGGSGLMTHFSKQCYAVVALACPVCSFEQLTDDEPWQAGVSFLGSGSSFDSRLLLRNLREVDPTTGPVCLSLEELNEWPVLLVRAPTWLFATMPVTLPQPGWQFDDGSAAQG